MRQTNEHKLTSRLLKRKKSFLPVAAALMPRVSRKRGVSSGKSEVALPPSKKRRGINEKKQDKQRTSHLSTKRKVPTKIRKDPKLMISKKHEKEQEHNTSERTKSFNGIKRRKKNIHIDSRGKKQPQQNIEEEMNLEEERLKEENEKEKVSQEVWDRFLYTTHKISSNKDSDLWMRIFFLGTEICNYPSLFDTVCDFSHFEDHIKGKLAEQMIYIFGSTEAHSFPDPDGGILVKLVPVLNVILSNLPPPEKVALTSLQSSREDVSHFRHWNLSWTPLLSSTKNYRTLRAKHWYLAFNQPRSKIKRSDQRVRGYQFLLPYVLSPSALERFEPSHSITFSMVIDGKVCAMDMETDCDEIHQRSEDLCEEHELDKTKYQTIVLRRLKDEKKKLDEKNAERRKQIEKELSKYSKDQIASLRSMKVYKYYPLGFTSAIRSHYISRTYGNSDQVFPPCGNPNCVKCERKKASSFSAGSAWTCVSCMTKNPVTSVCCSCCMTPLSK